MNDQNNTGDVRRFGLVAWLLFGSLCGLAIWRGRTWTAVFFGSLCFLGLLLTTLPRQMMPVHRIWLKTGHAIGQAMTYIVLTLFYFLMITPYTLVLRLLGRRPLPWVPDRGSGTYWKDREPKIQPKERFLKRY